MSSYHPQIDLRVRVHTKLIIPKDCEHYGFFFLRVRVVAKLIIPRNMNAMEFRDIPSMAVEKNSLRYIF